jgi:hypothetical protein
MRKTGAGAREDAVGDEVREVRMEADLPGFSFGS